MPISRQQLLKELLPEVEKLFGVAYEKYQRTEYRMKFSYGKYSIYRWDFEDGKRKSTTLAKGLSKEEATGMMKLLEDQHE
jgi:phosphoserine phosphatase